MAPRPPGKQKGTSMPDPGERPAAKAAGYAQFQNATVSKVWPDAVAGQQEGPVTSGETGPGLAERIAGALLGVHAGDSLGATLEFRSWESIRAEYPDGLTEIIGGGAFGWAAGAATDDTDLTRAVLLAYLRGDDADVVRSAAENMLRWLDGDWPGREPGSAPRDIGGATQQGLQRYRRTGDPRDSGAGQGHAGNGSLMRAIPTALAVPDRERRIGESMAISAITHDDRRATISCAAYNEMAAALLTGATPGASVNAGMSVARDLRGAAVVEAIRLGGDLQLAVIAATGDLPLPGKASGYVLDSLSLAAAAVLDPRPLRDVLVDVARLGNDSDTNAAIAGGLLGARDGAAAIPPAWFASLQFRQEFEAAANMLANHR
jgi:ADP-ribosylglycohydrolase